MNPCVGEGFSWFIWSEVFGFLEENRTYMKVKGETRWE
jgi:hypothetical protein